jgi:hypothetical protein
VSVAIAICVAVLAVAALATQPDLLSPAKFFLASFVLFHIGAWEGQRPLELWLLTLNVLAVGAITVAFEARGSARHLPPRRAPMPAQSRAAGATTRWLWLLSLPALFAQWYVIDYFGGLAGYINAVGMRVIEFRGLGWARLLTSMLLVVNLVYFACGLVERRSRGWWLGYGVHLLLLVGIGALSGSRSAVLTVFAMQLFMIHYLRRRLRAGRVVLVAVALVFGAGVLGAVRDGLKVDDGELRTGLDTAEGVFQAAVFRYGIEPLEILLQSDTRALAMGSTFATLLTNPVPRPLWPEKPDTGGVYFTKLYTGDAWDGASNLTPTFQGEWIINFGWYAGIPLFVLSYAGLMLATVRAYRAMLARLARGRDLDAAIALVRYVCIVWAVVGLMVGEVTSVLLALALNQLLPLFVLRRVLVRRPRATGARVGSGGRSLPA